MGLAFFINSLFDTPNDPPMPSGPRARSRRAPPPGLIPSQVPRPIHLLRSVLIQPVRADNVHGESAVCLLSGVSDVSLLTQYLVTSSHHSSRSRATPCHAVSDGAKLLSAPSLKRKSMTARSPDLRRRARGPPGLGRAGAVELVGRSPAITRVQELLRRARRTTPAPSSPPSPARRSSRSRASCTAQPPLGTPFVIVDCAAGRPGGVDRLLFGAARRRSLPTDLESVTRGQLHRRGASAGRCSSRTSPSCRAARRRSWRASRATAKSASTARRSPPTSASSPARRPASTPTCTRTASAAISTAGFRRCASICRRCAIAPTMCRRSRCVCWKTVRGSEGRPRDVHAGRARACSAR